MKNSERDNNKFLLKLYYLVGEFLSENQKSNENLAEVIVSFCTVTEKLFKIKLYKKNPILVFDVSKLKEDDALAIIACKKELCVETIKIREAINRYKVVFKNKFSDDELQALIDIYNIRNNLIHGYKSDDKILFDEENIIKKMGTVWEKISDEVILFFGKEKIKASKPRKKYTEEELENVLIKEVRKKIENTTSYNPVALYTIEDAMTYSPFYSNDKCPRCGAYDFSTKNSSLELNISFSVNSRITDLYKCKNCNLELTRKEYEIAKNIKK